MLDTIFLAEFLGIYMVIISAAFLLRKQNRDLLFKVYSHKETILVTGEIYSIIGLFLVLSNNFWTSTLSIIVAMLCWLILVRGLIRLFFPGIVIGMANKLKKSKALTTFFLVLDLLLGIIIAYLGFTA